MKDPDNDVDEKYTDIIHEKMKTVLHLAVQNEYIYIIKLLLKRKAIDIDVKDEQWRRPIDIDFIIIDANNIFI